MRSHEAQEQAMNEIPLESAGQGLPDLAAEMRRVRRHILYRRMQAAAHAIGLTSCPIPHARLTLLAPMLPKVAPLLASTT